MEMITQLINPFMNTVGTFMPKVLGALVLLVVGYVIASSIRKGMSALLGRMGVDERLQSKTGDSLRIEQLASNFVYYIILVYVLLLSLNILGVEGVLDPLKNMYSEFLAFVPNLLAGVLIAYLGFVIARVASSITEAVGKGLDTLSAKVGVGENLKLSRLAGQIVFLLVFVPILIAALDALRLEVISGPATEMLATLMAAIPQILTVAIILAVAYIGGKFVMMAVSELLKNMGADDIPYKIGIGGMFAGATGFSRFCGGLAFFFIMLAATVAAVDKLAMPQISEVLTSLLVFGGNVLLGLVILGVGSIIANLAHDALRRTADNEFVASTARVAILGLVLAMGLEAMNIADNIINLVLALTLGAVAVAIALSFGLGGREAAGKLTADWLGRLRSREKTHA